MPRAEIESDFPDLEGVGYVISSEIDEKYNCIAFAKGCKVEWIDPCPYPGYFWPDDVPRKDSIECLMAVMAKDKFEPCNDADQEDGYEKIAIYGRDGVYEHAARQLPDGRWTSKLGPDEDIEHDAPEGLCGELYGDVLCYMKRPKPT